MSSTRTTPAEILKGIEVAPPSPKELSIKERVERIKDEDTRADRNKLQKMDVATLRRTTFALLERDLKLLEKFPLKDLNTECLRRIRAYTDHCDPNGWYTLNYKQFDEGKTEGELTHETNVGLGEILVDASIDKVLVRRKEGGIVAGHRGIQGGRVCFLDDQNNYLATLTGDQFKILPNVSEEDEEKLELQATLENSIRESGEEAVRAIDWDQLPPELLAIRPVPKIPTGVAMTNVALEAKLEGYRPGEGEKIMDYSFNVCREFNIPPPVFWELVRRECNYDPHALNRDSKAGGMGQFLESTWEGFIKYCQQKGVHPSEWGSEPLTQDSRFNPYIAIYATAWYMKETQEKMKIDTRPPEEQAVLYYLAHHEGQAGAARYLHFLEIMAKSDYATPEAIRAFAKDHPEEFSRLAQGALDARQWRRIKIGNTLSEKDRAAPPPQPNEFRGLPGFLNVFYGVSKGVGEIARISQIGQKKAA